MLAQIGINIFDGKSIMNTSIPVEIFNTYSLL